MIFRPGNFPGKNTVQGATMRLTESVLILVLVGGIAACGSKDEAKGPSSAAINAGSAGAMEAAKTTATAEEVAEEARDDVDCPADINTPAPPTGAPVDDVVGVRPGLTWEEAANVVMCTNDLLVVKADTTRGFQMQTYGQNIRQGFNARFAEPRVEKSSQQIMQEMQDEAMARGGNAVRQDMQPGQSKWYVGTMGTPGQERVINAAREEWFAEGRNPTMASVEQALNAKYGTPTAVQKSPGQTNLYWSFDPLGRLITETSPLFNQCRGTADPNGGVNLSPDCGVTVAALLVPTTENPDLAKWLQVGTANQAAGYEAISATEQALQQGDNQRKAKEVEEAGKNADAPQL
ncbi:MAG: hypothetical protein IPG25_09345 [Proteobacteria bacterium]|nr:hypothetical protein [Pseudomonadota bacterium]